MLRCAPFAFPPFFSPRHHSRVPSLFRRYAPYKSSHPDQSVADLTRPRRFLQNSFRRSALFRCAEMRAVHSLLVSPLHSKLSLFHLFPLAGLCLPLNALSHIIPRCMRPPLFGLNSSATLSLENSFESTRSVAPLYSAARKCEPFIRSSFLRSTRNYRSFTHFRSRRKSVGF